MKSGAIYLVKAENGLVKIGRATSPRSRISKMQGDSPIPLTLIHMAKVEDTSAVENGLHLEFADKRARGEWFWLTEDDVASIQERYPATNITFSAGKQSILFGVTPKELERLRTAARMEGLSMSQFARRASLNAARAILEGTIVLE